MIARTFWWRRPTVGSMGSWDLPIGLLILCLVALAFGALAADSRPGFSDGRTDYKERWFPHSRND